jgi:hypothetical protein
MATKRETVTFTALNKEIKDGKFKNIYVLQGEEPYYIDRPCFPRSLIFEKMGTDNQRHSS